MDSPKTYRTDVSSTSYEACYFVHFPKSVEFTIDEQTARFIVELRHLVTTHGLSRIEKIDWRATYLRNDSESSAEAPVGENNEISTECSVLNVSDDEFWYSARIRHTNIEIESEHQSIDELAKHFSLNTPAQQR